jgi:multimeric flavodoxin WrbA
MSNIVLLSGSPRRGATTDKLTAAFIEGAAAAGNNVTLFNVSDMKIGGCIGCGHCFKQTGVCIQKDDMQVILDALRKADVLVLATPVYYFSFTAQLKLAIDRTYALLKERTPIKKAALLITCGAGVDAANSTVATFRQIIALQNWKEAGIVIAPRLHAPNDIDGREELNIARRLGEKM